MRALRAQVLAELSMTLRRGETLLLTLGIPLVLLVFFSQIRIGTGEPRHPVDLVTPGILALAVMSTSMVSLGIATGFERGYGVLKRLGSTPLGRQRLLLAKFLSVLLIEILQAILIVAVGFALGWNPTGGLPGALLAAVAMVLGSVAFGGIGLTMAGRLRAEVNLAAANGLYIVLLLLGGMVVPLSDLPSALRTIAEILPAAALTSAIHDALGPPISYAGCWVVLVIWSVLTPVMAALSFRFEGD